MRADYGNSCFQDDWYTTKDYGNPCRIKGQGEIQETYDERSSGYGKQRYILPYAACLKK